ncbi:hypothetical protein IQ260_00510 [Leptolyngbya cf. ectocarpi LEGE 11479]|uniref:Uncharacterized protein n=1 Tax=Leptolyngbya cf. ectocarpi LEGE 11479 TaxID=1828722 RepID=A0A928X098_LEPEC|nr:hypothetical protein [Leptolyngbya ectocarpi]MBE9065134.1 hypothetical protein [Leptolyngbya cf. ectocarpi LEGE 11479]
MQVQHDVIDPFLTYLDQNPEYGQSDKAKAVEQLSVRQGLIQDWLDGKEYVDAVLDCIEEHGLNAAGYVEAVTDAVDHFICNDGAYYITNESGVLLPAHMNQ